MMFKLNRQKNKQQNNRGFTIIESLVAITILLIAITGPMFFTQSALRTSMMARDQITAFFLAQDAIEYIKNIRDNNAIYNLKNPASPRTWLVDSSKNSFYQYCDIDGDTSNGCDMDTFLGTYFEHVNNRNLAIDNNGFFVANNSFASRSIFNRKILIEEIVLNREAVITVTVTFKTNSLTSPTRTITVKEHIFNWSDGLKTTTP